MRSPKFSLADLKKIYNKFFASQPNETKNHSDDRAVDVYAPFMIPFFSPLFRTINRMVLSRQINRYLKKHGVGEYILVATIPVVADVIETLAPQKTVYYCVDEFSEWPGHNREQMQAMENKFIALSDVVITTSQNLYESKKKAAKAIHYLPHGADVAHFAPSNMGSEDCTDTFPHPLIGYYGLFDERNNIVLIEQLLQSHPDCTFIVIGEVRADIERLRRYPNIIFYGAVPYDILPGIVRHFDVCVLPYNLDRLTENINPLKFKEYLATEKPVVTSALPDLKRFEDVIGWAESNTDFIKKIEYFLCSESQNEKTQRIQKTRQYLKQESWEHKAQTFLSYINGR